ncbi:hypothetical protein N665_2328s0001 [Sinapis alba]|nr:hypothetical protein N665_2328s0001 [Sinapis alba]
MVLKKLLRPSRYFDPPDEAGLMTDSSCEEQEDSRKRCFICASFEHVGEQCSMGGHDSCPNDESICLRCGDMGHDMSLCKYEYSEDDLKDVQCYVCKRFGHMCCGEALSSSWAVSCYKCGKLGHVGLGCGRHYEEPPTCWGKKHCSSRLAEKKRRRLAKALAASVAIRDRLEKKKQMKLEEQQQHSTIHGSNGKKNDGNFEEGSSSHQSNGKKTDENSTPHESNGKKNDTSPEQHYTLHESNGKTKKDNVEPPLLEQSNDRSGWITEDVVFGKHQEEAEFSRYTIGS